MIGRHIHIMASSLPEPPPVGPAGVICRSPFARFVKGVSRYSVFEKRYCVAKMIGPAKNKDKWVYLLFCCRRGSIYACDAPINSKHRLDIENDVRNPFQYRNV